jgi:hypothetical protein
MPPEIWNLSTTVETLLHESVN